MGNKLTVSNRIKIGFAFAIVFLLVLATNRLDKRRFDRINESLTSIYEDRLVAKGHLYQLSSVFHKKEKALLSDSQNAKDVMAQSNIDQLILDYNATKLTNEEKAVFNKFRQDYEALRVIENTSSDIDSASNKSKMKMHLNRIQEDLDNLAKIQISEGESLTKFAQNSFDTSDTMSKIEIAVILLIGIVVQFIIFKR